LRKNASWAGPRRQLADDILVTRLTAVFAARAMLLAAVGLYGVLARRLAERRCEIGIRVALGAAPASIARLVARDALGMTLAGILARLAGALALSRVLDNRLYGISSLEPLSLAGAVLVTVLAALIAAAIPAWRAARIDVLHPTVRLSGAVSGARNSA
jgi:ABC-type antimicrobial peptide transport system permease subunit